MIRQQDSASAGSALTKLARDDHRAAPGLARLAERGVLRHHAEAILAKAYGEAVERVAVETDLPAESFPAACPYTLDQLLSFDGAAA